MKKKALIFAGTTEGRELTDFLSKNEIDVTVSTATEYGESVIETNDYVKTDSIRGVDNMAERMKEFDVVVDATHPYAVRKSEHIREASETSGIPLIRIIRPDSDDFGNPMVFPDIPSAVEYLSGTEGNIFVTTGSNDLSEFTSIPGYKDRVFARVLSLSSVAEKCASLGFEGRNLMLMEGPYGEELNLAMMKHVNARYLVTKDSGSAGGFEDKMSASAKAGVIPIVIGRPAEHEGISVEEAEKKLAEMFSIAIPKKRRKITIGGIGTGNKESMTLAVIDSVKNSDLVIGAKRMLESFDLSGKKILEEYRSEEILEYVETHPEYGNVTVIMSGDTGYYSGTKKLMSVFKNKDYDITVLPGISSVSYFFSKLGESWDDVYLTSVHGRDENITGLVKRHRRLFTLLNGEESAHEMCRELIEYGLDDVKITIGQDFGTQDERIDRGRPEDILGKSLGKLCVAFIENPEASDVVPLGISDEEFVRSSVPMTKSEVRSLSVMKLKLNEDSVIYDVGAGTGSVSVEMASVALSGRVYAVEKNKDAVSLIKENRKKFGTPNITVIEGPAPDVLADLPTPTHAFIGGSSGNLESIINVLLDKNPGVRIVITSVTLETLTETMRCVKELNLTEEETLCVNVSKARLLGNYHLMTAQNPVYITVCRGGSR